jgi:ABC-2 type transport system ATP-binding protein
LPYPGVSLSDTFWGAKKKELPAGVRHVQAEIPCVWLAFEHDAIAAHELVAWLGSRYVLRDVTFQDPEIEDVIRSISENGLLL